jgi:hypothetical protein
MPLQGPSVSIDTACSSSLVGAHLACTSFLPGGCSRSLATGVNLTIRAETTAVLSKAGMLTVDGRCKTLDASADGYMRGEACVVHLLEAAPADGGAAGFPAAAAVILGTAVNQDGRSSSLTAPNGPSQQAVVRAALAWNGVAAGDVGVLEMHGTGTALGDPIEVGAAFAVFQVGYSSADGDLLKRQLRSSLCRCAERKHCAACQCTAPNSALPSSVLSPACLPVCLSVLCRLRDSTRWSSRLPSRAPCTPNPLRALWASPTWRCVWARRAGVWRLLHGPLLCSVAVFSALLCPGLDALFCCCVASPVSRPIEQLTEPIA